MWPLRTILYFTTFWIACLLALINPIWGVLNYVMTYQTYASDTWWGAPLISLGMRFSMLAALFTLAGFLIGRKHVPHANPSVAAWEIGIVTLVVMAAFGAAAHPSTTEESRYAFEKLWKMMLFVLILGRLAILRKNLKMIIWSFVAGSLFIGYDAFTAPPSAFYLGRLELIGGPDFSSTSGAAAHLAAMLPIIGTAFLIAHGWHWRLFALISGAFTFNAIILCRTRSAFIGMLVGVLTAIMMAPRTKRFRIHAMIVVGVLVAFSLTDTHFWSRMNTMVESDLLSTDVAAASRLDLWKASFEILRDNPFGIGPGNFPAVVGSYDPRYYQRSAHNTVLVVFTELGIQGGLLFLVMTAGSFYYLFRAVRLSRQCANGAETRLLAYGMLVSIVTYFITGLGTERFYCESFWWVLAMPLSLYRMVRGEILAAHAAEASLVDEIEYEPEAGQPAAWPYPQA